MKNNHPKRKMLAPILTALFGAAAGFGIFLFTGQIIFLIAFVPISTVLGIILSNPEEQNDTPEEPGVK
ncbi:hypothetical protein KQH50_00085 [bacterium]|nr:hypothetical protein [bacterium]